MKTCALRSRTIVTREEPGFFIYFKSGPKRGNIIRCHARNFNPLITNSDENRYQMHFGAKNVENYSLLFHALVMYELNFNQKQFACSNRQSGLILKGCLAEMETGMQEGGWICCRLIFLSVSIKGGGGYYKSVSITMHILHDLTLWNPSTKNLDVASYPIPENQIIEFEQSEIDIVIFWIEFITRVGFRTIFNRGSWALWNCNSIRRWVIDSCNLGNVNNA